MCKLKCKTCKTKVNVVTKKEYIKDNGDIYIVI